MAGTGESGRLACPRCWCSHPRTIYSASSSDFNDGLEDRSDAELERLLDEGRGEA